MKLFRLTLHRYEMRHNLMNHRVRPDMHRGSGVDEIPHSGKLHLLRNMVKMILFRIVKSLRFKKPVRVIRMSQSIQPNSNCLFPILRYKVPPYDISVPLSFL